MDARKFDLPRDTACSFETVLHPEYDTIKAKCDPWLLTLAQPTSLTAAEFWVDSLITFLTCLAYPHGPAHRVTNLSKFLGWVFFFDDEEDDPARLGCDSIDNPTVSRRHKIILACCSDDPLTYNADPSPVRWMALFRDLWQDMSKDMSTRLQARLYTAMRDYLNAVALEMHYRGTGIIPTVNEYIVLRQSTSIVGVCFVLLEYALGIELDDESLQNDKIKQLFDTGIDHVCFTNDIMSCEVELSRGDHFNLPAIIYQNKINNVTSKANCKPAAFLKPNSINVYNFQDAIQEAVKMLDEVDEQCARLTKELLKSELVKRKGIEKYVKGIGEWAAANKTWSLKTARYTHNCPAKQDVVLAVK